MAIRLTETRLRQIIRETLTLLEGDSHLPRGYVNPQVHSMGWIDPEGTYHYDSDYPDHSEWAGMVAIPNIPGAIEELAQRLEAAGALKDAPGKDLESLVYSSGAKGEKEIRNMLLERGWAKVSNAYTIEIWNPTQRVLGTWLDLGMEADCDPTKEFRVFGERGSRLVTGSWTDVEEFLKELP
jgi:hypothetical protein